VVQALAALARPVQANSGQELTGPVHRAQIAPMVQIVQGLIEQDRIVQGLIAKDPTSRELTVPVSIVRLLIVQPLPAPAVHVPLAAPVAAEPGNSAQAVPPGQKAIARGPLPPAPANPAQAALGPATNAPQHPQQESQRGSLKQVALADPLPVATQNRPLAPDLADSRSPASKAKLAADASRPQGALAVKAPAANREGKSVADIPEFSRMPHLRIAC
jgi:hypothetical protein